MRYALLYVMQLPTRSEASYMPRAAAVPRVAHAQREALATSVYPARLSHAAHEIKGCIRAKRSCRPSSSL